MTTGNVPDEIGAQAINNWLFNADTIDAGAWHHVMEHGIKVEGGEKLGKTIIFARNHPHALAIRAASRSSSRTTPATSWP
jgi:type I restriction enzyme R subunit